MSLRIPGMTLMQEDDALILRSESRLRTLASAVVGGGWGQARTILVRHVSKHYDHPDPAADLQAFARSRGIQNPFVGLMTAAYLDRGARVVELAEGDLALTLVMTAGFSNATAAGLSPPAGPEHLPAPGTINLILIIDAPLTPAAMVNAVITVTEAKTAMIQAWGMQAPGGHPATGTSTDAVVIACRPEGEPLPYAGPVTRVGHLIARAVRLGMESARPESN